MVNYQLEDVAIELRKALKIDIDLNINPKYLDELCQKIQNNISNIKIIKNEDGPKVTLKDGENWTIYICGNEEEKFYNLCEMLSFIILFDKKSLNGYELENSEFRFPRSKMNYDMEYLNLAFMMPRKAFLRELIKYSSGDGSSVKMSKMQEEVNKYCYKRGVYSDLW